MARQKDDSHGCGIGCLTIIIIVIIFAMIGSKYKSREALEESLRHTNDDVIKFLRDNPGYKFLPKDERELRYWPK